MSDLVSPCWNPGFESPWIWNPGFESPLLTLLLRLSLLRDAWRLIETSEDDGVSVDDELEFEDLDRFLPRDDNEWAYEK